VPQHSNLGVLTPCWQTLGTPSIATHTQAYRKRLRVVIRTSPYRSESGCLLMGPRECPCARCASAATGAARRHQSRVRGNVPVGPCRGTYTRATSVMDCDLFLRSPAGEETPVTELLPTRHSCVTGSHRRMLGHDRVRQTTLHQTHHAVAAAIFSEGSRAQHDGLSTGRALEGDLVVGPVLLSTVSARDLPASTEHSIGHTTRN